MEGSVRTLKDEDKAIIKKRLNEICSGVAVATETSIQLKYTDLYPSTINDIDLVRVVTPTVLKIFG